MVAVNNKRQIRKRIRRSKKETMEIDITSLLDILVVILIFLLKSYSASNVIINIPKEVNLPLSQTQKGNETGVTLQVSDQKLFIDDQMVADLRSSKNIFDESGLRIIPLYNELVRKRESSENLVKSTGADLDFDGKINLVMDKDIEYDFLRKLMYTSGEAGFLSFKFVVLASDP
jgi:biopolymer transport protein ExbD